MKHPALTRRCTKPTLLTIMFMSSHPPLSRSSSSSWNRPHNKLYKSKILKCLYNKKEVRSMEKNALDWISLILVIIGGLNWGLVGLFDLNLVETILGSIPILQKIVYILVGLAALYTIYYVSKN